MSEELFSLGDAIEAGTRHSEPKPFKVDGANYVAHGLNIVVDNIDADVDAASPRRTSTKYLRNAPTLSTADSFIEYIQANADAAKPFGTPNVFISEECAVAIMDANDDKLGGNRWRVEMPIEHSRQYRVWKDVAGASGLSQAAFADFVEQNILDISAPPSEQSDLGKMAIDFAQSMGTKYSLPNEVLTTARGLSVHERSTVKSSVRSGSGEADIIFQSEHTDREGNKLHVPRLFSIVIPIFKDGPMHFMPVGLRYRVRDGALKFAIDLPLKDRTEKSALEAMSSAMKTRLKGVALVYNGKI